MKRKHIDIETTFYGSIVTIAALTRRAQGWMAKHVHGLAPRQSVVHCDHREGVNIAQGALDFGLALRDAPTGRIARRAATVLAVAVLLSACAADTPVSPTAVEVGRSIVQAYASVVELRQAFAGGLRPGGTMTLSVRAATADGQAVPNAPIVWSASRGQIAGMSSTTDVTGIAGATLTTDDETVVTATIGGASGSTTVKRGTVFVGISYGPVSLTDRRIEVGLPIRLTVFDYGDANPTAFRSVLWDFEEAQVEGGAAVVYGFTLNRLYTVSAHVVTTDGREGTATQQIPIGINQPPVTIAETRP
jgi:hypothetical protein